MKVLRGVVSLALLMPASGAFSQPVALVIGQEDLARMSPEARAHFHTASQTVFRHPESSFEELRQAADLAPDVADLQFLLADFAVSMTLHSVSPESQAYSQVILDCAERVIANPDADQRRLRRVSNFLSLYYVPGWTSGRPARMTPGLTPDTNQRIGEILMQIRERLDGASPEAASPASPPRVGSHEASP